MVWKYSTLLSSSWDNEKACVNFIVCFCVVQVFGLFRPDLCPDMGSCTGFYKKVFVAFVRALSKVKGAEQLVT